MYSLTSLLVGALALCGSAAASPVADGQTTGSSGCVAYKPVGWKSAKGAINFYNNNPNKEPGNGPGFEAPTLPANASAVTPWALSNHSTSHGSAFTFRACNASGLTTNGTQSSCSHGGCYTTYTNYVQVVNPATGHCLTALAGWEAANSTRHGFRACAAAPDRSQLWETDQQVLYSPGYGKVTSYGSVQFNNIQPGFGESGSLLAWVLDRKDNRTIETIKYQYTQDGLSANLLEA